MFNQREAQMTATAPTKPETSKRTPAVQPLHAAQISDALLKLATVQALTGLGKTTIYAKAATGELTPIRLGARCTRWRAGQVQQFLQAQGK
jgi:predicted DNA-binding transcriptional regulator AlpA